MTIQVYFKGEIEGDTLVFKDPVGNHLASTPKFLKIKASCFERGRLIRLYITNNIVRYGEGDLKKYGTGLTDATKDSRFEKFIISNSKTKMTDAKKSPVLTGMASEIQNSITKKPETLFVQELKWKYLVRTMMRGQNILLTGHSGFGKTESAYSLAQAYPERPFFKFNLGDTTDPKNYLIGKTGYDPEKGTLFAQSEFIKAITTDYAIILLDELSRSHPDAVNILMTVLDAKQRYLRIDELAGTPIVNVASGVCFVATANIGNEYTATRVIDRALVDRFTIIEIDMLDASDEAKLLTQRFSELDKRYTKACAQIAAKTRNEYLSENSKLSTVISVRMNIEFAGLIVDGFTMEEAAEVAILPFFDKDGGANSERAFVKQIIQANAVVDEDETLYGSTTEKPEENKSVDYDPERMPFDPIK